VPNGGSDEAETCCILLYSIKVFVVYDGTPCLHINYSKHNGMNPNKIVFCIPPSLFKFEVWMHDTCKEERR
jgi:hypothetical protein